MANQKLHKIGSALLVSLSAVLFLPPGLQSSQLRINEFLASNDTTIADPQGEFDDYIELFNPLSEVMSIEGMYISDDYEIWNKWQFPEGTIIPGEGYLLVWADGDDGDYPGLHTNFRLDKNGETIVLTDSDLHGNTLLDSLGFTLQTADISFGRYPDGGGTWGFMAPTPSEGNIPLEVFLPGDAVSPTAGLTIGCYPNPFNPLIRIEFSVSSVLAGKPVTIDIFDSGGRLIRKIIENERFDPGVYTYTWNGRNDSGSHVSSGVYILRTVTAGEETGSIRIVLCR